MSASYRHVSIELDSATTLNIPKLLVVCLWTIPDLRRFNYDECLISIAATQQDSEPASSAAALDILINRVKMNDSSITLTSAERQRRFKARWQRFLHGGKWQVSTIIFRLACKQ